MPHPFFDEPKFPWNRPDAKTFYKALYEAVPNPSRIEFLYEQSGSGLPPLNTFGDAAQIWKDALTKLAAASVLDRLCQGLLDDLSIRAIHPSVEAVIAAKADAPREESVEGRRPSPSRAAIVAGGAILIVLLAYLLWDRAIRAKPFKVSVGIGGGVAYVGPHLAETIQAIRDDACAPSAFKDWLRQRQCIALQDVDDRVGSIVQCTTTPEMVVSNRDPSIVLRELAAASPCVTLSGTEGRQWSVRLNDQAVTRLPNDDRYYCGCSPEALDRLRKD